MSNIELVIKISEETYKSIQDNDYCGISNADMYNAIKNGTILPKGHEKIIDANFALEAKITESNNGVSDRTKGWNEACQAIFENAPTIIEAEQESEE